MEPDVGCSEGEKRDNTMMTQKHLSRPEQRGRPSPLGILNLLSFLYHRQPLSPSAIRTGNSVSGQSDGFRVKSEAGK